MMPSRELEILPTDHAERVGPRVSIARRRALCPSKEACRYSLSCLLLILNTSCSDKSGGVASGAGSSGIAGALASLGGGGSSSTGGTSSEKAGAAGLLAGSAGTSGEASSGGGAGGGPGLLTPEQLLTATYAECSKGCSLVRSACPSTNYADCVEGCNTQADILFDSGSCAVEFYDGWYCINHSLGPGDVICASTQSASAQFKGCEVEQSRYAQCQ